MTNRRSIEDNEDIELQTSSLINLRTSGNVFTSIEPAPETRRRPDLPANVPSNYNYQPVQQFSARSIREKLEMSLQSKHVGKSRSCTAKVAGKHSNPKKLILGRMAQRPPKGCFVFGIIDHSNAFGRINEEYHSALEEAFNNALASLILASPDNCTNIQISNSEFVEGIYMINVASLDFIDELRDMVEKMPKLWPRAKLCLVSDIVLPLLTKAAFCVKRCGDRRPTEEILKIIGRQNSELKVNLWEIYDRVENDYGTFIVVGIDPMSVAYLKKSKGQMFYLARKLVVKIQKTVFYEYSLREIRRISSLTVNMLQVPSETTTLSEC